MLYKYAAIFIACGISAMCGGHAIQAAIANNRRAAILSSIACAAAAAVVKWSL